MTMAVLVQAVTLAPDRARAATGPATAAVAKKSANRAGALGLVRDARRVVSAEVVDIATGESKGMLAADEMKKLSEELRHASAHDGGGVVTTPPWEAVLVLSTRTGKHYVAQLVGDQWLRIEDPDPLARRATGQPPSAARASEVSVGYPTVVWKALERILGPTKNKEYLKEPASLH